MALYCLIGGLHQDEDSGLVYIEEGFGPRKRGTKREGRVRMLMFKACPRCRGDVYLDRDIYGFYFTCLQCGHVWDTDPRKLQESKGGAGGLKALQGEAVKAPLASQNKSGRGVRRVLVEVER